jgi:hypothetical protein
MPSLAEGVDLRMGMALGICSYAESARWLVEDHMDYCTLVLASRVEATVSGL